MLAEFRYDFGGFYQPVDNPGTTGVVNTAKAGAAIPIRFTLGWDFGLDVLAAGSPTSTPYTCSSASENAIEETVTSSTSSFSYEPGAERYSYIWKTDKAWSGTCRKLKVTLKDGTSHEALFKLN